MLSISWATKILGCFYMEEFLNISVVTDQDFVMALYYLQCLIIKEWGLNKFLYYMKFCWNVRVHIVFCGQQFSIQGIVILREPNCETQIS